MLIYHLTGILIQFIFIFSYSEKTTEPQNVLLEAIKICLLENEGIRLTAREHGIDKNSLQRYVKKVKANFEDISSVNDNELLEFIRISGTRTPSNMVCLFYSTVFLHDESFFL